MREGDPVASMEESRPEKSEIEEGCSDDSVCEKCERRKVLPTNRQTESHG